MSKASTRTRSFLQGATVAVIGDHGSDRKPEATSRWVEVNGGKFAQKFGTEVTHLLCSEDQWKQKPEVIRKAMESKNCSVVIYEWLEDSIDKKRKYHPRAYLCEKKFRETAKARAARKKLEDKKLGKESVATLAAGFFSQHARDIKDGNNAIKDGRPTVVNSTIFDKMNQTADVVGSGVGGARDEAMSDAAEAKPAIAAPSILLRQPKAMKHNTDPKPDVENHHLYRDRTGFAYNIILGRTNIMKNTNEIYILRLYESHTTPHTYAVHLKCQGIRDEAAEPPISGCDTLSLTEGQTIVPPGSDWAAAFSAFSTVFRAKTNRAWEDRLSKIPVQLHTEGARPFTYANKPWDTEPKGVFPVPVPLDLPTEFAVPMLPMPPAQSSGAGDAEEPDSASRCPRRDSASATDSVFGPRNVAFAASSPPGRHVDEGDDGNLMSVARDGGAGVGSPWTQGHVAEERSARL